MTAIQNRYEFVYLLDVCNGNPNGDPDAGNLPRIDPETNLGMISDVCIKRKIRNYADLAKSGESRYGIYVRESSVLNDRHREAYAHVRGNSDEVATAKKLSPKGTEEETALRQFMVDNFFDVRTFGAVMGTNINCGQVRGPVQFSFGRSVEPILPLEIAITRMAATKAGEAKAAKEDEDNRTENRTMGRKYIVPYGLYRIHGYVSAPLAAKTGFDETDLELLWESLSNMLDHDRSAARGEMAARKLIVFKHQSPMGNARASELFDMVKIDRNGNGDLTPARSFSDYTVSLNGEVPEGVEVIEKF